MVVGWNPVAAYSIYNVKYYVPNEISVVFHAVSNYGYHFIISISKELAKEFEEDFECCGENRKVQNLFHSNRKGSYKNR